MTVGKTPRKRPPATVVRFQFADGTSESVPSAEVLARQIEQLTEWRLMAQQRSAAALAQLEGPGPLDMAARTMLAEEGLAAQAGIEAARAGRARVVAQLQLIIDLAARAEFGSARGAKTTSALGDATRAAFAQALQAAQSAGKHLSAGNVAEHWPAGCPPVGKTRMGELLREWRAAQERPPPG